MLVLQLLCSITKEVLLNCIPNFFLKYFKLGKKRPCNAISLEFYIPFDF